MHRKLKHILLPLVATIALILATVLPPQPGFADTSVVKRTAVITGTSTDVSLIPLTGQSSCSVEIVGTASGTTQVLQNSTWVNVDSTIPSESSGAYTPSPTISGPGTFIANCGGMLGFKFHPTSVTGSATITVMANGGVSRVLGAGVNGDRSVIAGTAPITVSTPGNEVVIGMSPIPLSFAYGGTNATAIPSGCLQSDGTAIISTGASCTTPAPAATPVSVQAGTGIAVATPLPGVFVVSNTGVTSVSGTGNIASSGGTTPTVSITDAPTFAGNVTLSALSPGVCVDTNSTKVLISASEPCPIAKSSATFVIPSIGSTVAVSIQSPTYFPNENYTPVVVTDGTHSMCGVVTAGATTSTLTIQNTGMLIGSVGNTMANNAYIGSACAGSATGVTSVSGTGNIQSTGGTTPTISFTAAPSIAHTITLGSAGSAASPNNAYIAMGSGSGTTYITNNISGSTCNGLVGTMLQINDGTTNAFCLDNGGNLAIPGGFTANNLTDKSLTVSQCVQATTGSTLASSGEACPITYQAGVRLAGNKTEVGSMNISAVAGSCVAGSAVVYASPFTATPNIELATQAELGVTVGQSPGSTFDATQFTPAVCSDGTFSGVITVWYQATGW